MRRKAGSARWSIPTWPRNRARLQALQIRQQLGTQALGIANQAPQSLLSLFRG